MNENVTAIITTLDNLPLLTRQLGILGSQVKEIIVVNNGSIDGTKDYLDKVLYNGVTGIRVIHRANKGAGPGRNAGLNLWNGSTDYVLMVDGGILPLHGSVDAMVDYLQRHPDIDVISPEVHTCFTDREEEASRRMTTIPDGSSFAQSALSSTAYAMCRKRAWDGIRFSEEGPFGEPGWGVDDNEMQCRWNKAGILHHDFTFAQTGVKLYRRSSGSFHRLSQETGIWPNQYGSVYEKRLVKLFQDWRGYFDDIYRAFGNIQYSFIIKGIEFPEIAYVIKNLHDYYLEKRISHEIIVDTKSLHANTFSKTFWFLRTFALRQIWGDTTIDSDTGEIIKRNVSNEAIWTGDIQLDTPPRGKHVIEVTEAHAKRLLEGHVL